MKINISFDLDGTLFDLYGKENWLYLLENHLCGAFEGDMLPEIDKREFLTIVYKLRDLGVHFEVVTWLPKNATKEYEWVCTEEKKRWCAEHLPFINSVRCVPYGTPKQKVASPAGRMYLIDDNSQICAEWETKVKRKAINVSSDFTAVDALVQIFNELTA